MSRLRAIALAIGCALVFALSFSPLADASVVAVDVGTTSSCYVSGDGKVFCWGRVIGVPASGPDDATTHTSEPVQVPELTGATAVSTDDRTACAIVAGGAVKCWGNNSSGQLGDGTRKGSVVPVQVDGLTSGATAIAVEGDFACAVVSGGVKCWGDRSLAKEPAGIVLDPLKPFAIPGLESGVTSISAGHLTSYVCVIQSGAAKCWGNNSWMGNPPRALTQVPNLDTGVTSLSVSQGLSCAIKSGGTWCWGGNLLGDGSSGSIGPSQPTGLTTASAKVDATGAGACVVRTAGDIRCWGTNVGGLFGNGNTTTTTTPVEAGVTSGATAVSVDRSAGAGCAIVEAALKCWGAARFGRLANGTLMHSLTPLSISGLDDVTALSSDRTGACAIDDGAGKCWGWKAAFTLIPADEAFPGATTGPMTIPGLESGVTDIAWDSHTGCAAVSGAAKCWGSNGSGQLYMNDSSPTALTTAGLTSGVSAVDVGDGRSCAVASGSLKCWGWQVGPVQMIAETGAADVKLGHTFGCSIVANAAKCWKAASSTINDGQFGNGDGPASTNQLVQVVGLTSGVAAISTGEEFACAVKNGGASCWGVNRTGQLGDGTLTGSNVPVPVDGLSSGVTSIDSGNDSSCAIVSGAVKCWGANEHGQLGDGTTNPSSVPVPVSGIDSGATAVAAGDLGACAVVNGDVRCWGDNRMGQLSQGTARWQPYPIDVAAGQPGPPRLEIFEPIDGDYLPDASPVATFDASTGADTTCKIDEGHAFPCADGGELPELEDGLHRLRVIAVNEHGSAVSEYVEFVVDTVAPTVSISSPLNDEEYYGSRVALDFSFDEDLIDLVCTLDGLPIDECIDVYLLTDLELGAHSLSIVATDLAGNVGTAQSDFSREVEPTPPVTTPKPQPPVVPQPRPPIVVEPGQWRINPIGRPKQRRGKRSYRFEFKIAPQQAGSCDGKLNLTLRHKKKSSSTTSGTSPDGPWCTAVLRLSVPKSWSGKRVAMVARHAGNAGMTAFTKRGSVKLK